MGDFVCENPNGLFFVFDELNKKNKPCLDLKNVSDVLLFVDVMNFSKKNCIKLDGCCSARVHTSIAYLSNLINPPPPPPVPSDEINIDDLLKDIFTNNCPESRCTCE